MLTNLDHHAHLELFRDASGTLDYVTCDQASLVFFRGGKEHLIQLLDYSSASPLLKYLSARMSVMPSPEKFLRGRELHKARTA